MHFIVAETSGISKLLYALMRLISDSSLWKQWLNIKIWPTFWITSMQMNRALKLNAIMIERRPNPNTNPIRVYSTHGREDRIGNTHNNSAVKRNTKTHSSLSVFQTLFIGFIVANRIALYWNSKCNSEWDFRYSSV